jgi:hypothetical protein
MSGKGYDEAGARVVSDWYSGGKAIPWDAWLIPLLAWGALLMAIYFMFCCLAVMLRAQWAEREALAFPLLRLPLTLTEDLDRPDRYGLWSRFVRNPIMWVGFFVAAFIQLLNGLNFYYPDIPLVPLNINTAALFVEAPWNQLGDTPIRVFPIMVGITYLLTSEISFSLWSFYWLFKMQYVLAYYFGFLPQAMPSATGTVGDAKAFAGYQQMGCMIAYVAIVLWTGREHFRQVARRAFGRVPRGAGEKTEMMSYPLAFWGFLLSFAFIAAWSMAAGIGWDVALVFWITYLVLAIALTRVVTESGLLAVQPGWEIVGRSAQLGGAGPGAWLTTSSMVPVSFLQTSIATGMAAFLLPAFVQSFKLAHDRKIQPRPLLILIFACILIALSTSLWMTVRLGYTQGGLNLNSWFAHGGGQWPAGRTAEMINGVENRGWFNWAWLGIGGLATWGMMLARSRMAGFPFHPIGYMMALNYPMGRLWFSIMLGWACKVVISRYGGHDTYRKLVPAFLGLTLGDVALMLFWLGIDGWQGRTYHQLMPD